MDFDCFSTLKYLIYLSVFCYPRGKPSLQSLIVFIHVSANLIMPIGTSENITLFNPSNSELFFFSQQDLEKSLVKTRPGNKSKKPMKSI